MLMWVVAVILWWDIRRGAFDWTLGVVLVGVVMAVAAGISRFTIKQLGRPLRLLEAGISSVRQGRLEPIQVSRTNDEIIRNCWRTGSGNARRNWRTLCELRSTRARPRANFWRTCRTSSARL